MRPTALDDRWLPRLAGATQRAVAHLRGVARHAAGPGTALGDGVRAEPALAGSITAVAVAAVVLAVAGGPGGPPAAGDDTGPAPQPPAPVTTTLGPSPGTAVAPYLSLARDDLRRFDAGSRGRPGYALVDLTDYLRPSAAASLFGGVEVVRAYVRVPAPGLPTQVHALPLQGAFGSLAAGMQASGRLAAATAHTFGVLVQQMRPHGPQDVTLRERYALQQRASSYEAGRLQRPATCACVFAVVVHADAARLDRFAADPRVRVVDAAPPEVPLDAVTILPLEPEVTDVVPRGGLFGG